MTSTFGATGLALTAAALWGGGDFSGGLATRRASPFFVVALAHGLSLVALLILAVALRLPLPSTHFMLIGLYAGLAGGLGLIALYKALSLGKMGLSASVGGLVTAAIPVVFSFLSEGLPHRIQLAGFVIAAVAIWLIAYAPTEREDTHARGLGLATFAGICFGILLILLRVASGGGVLWALSFSRIGSVSVAVVALLQSLRKPSARAALSVAEGRWQLLALGALAGLLDTGGNLLYTLSSLVGRLDIAAVVSSLYPAGTILLAAWLLKERTTRTQTVGMALALVAVALISI